MKPKNIDAGEFFVVDLVAENRQLKEENAKLKKKIVWLEEEITFLQKNWQGVVDNDRS